MGKIIIMPTLGKIKGLLILAESLGQSVKIYPEESRMIISALENKGLKQTCKQCNIVKKHSENKKWTFKKAKR